MSQVARTVDPAVLRLTESVEARLRAPVLPDGAVHRTALVNRLRAERAPLVLVTAPAGYGKTTLLAQWARRDGRPFAWVRLLPSDRNPVTFLRGLVDALDRLAPLDEAIALPLRARPLRVETVARRLGKWLLERDEPFVLVIDNADFATGEATAAIIAALAEHIPPGAQLVLAARRQPRLPIARRRAQGLVSEISELDLRLTDREASRLLAAAGLTLDEADVDELNERAEGWPAGLTLAALALEPRRGHPARSVDGFSGAHHFVSEFFEAEVLAHLDPKDVAFAMRVSLLERLSGSACDAVLQAHGSGERLRRLAHAGAFLVPCDREHHDYRFQSLFRDMLRARLEQFEPAKHVQLSRRAAGWAAREGDVVHAIERLRAIRDEHGAARLLGTAAPGLSAGRLLELLEPSLIDLGEDSLLAGHQSAAVSGALAHALLGHTAATAHWAGVAERARSEGPLVDGTKRSTAWLKVLQALLCRDGVERMREDAEAARAVVAPRSPMALLSQLLLGIADALRGDEAAAEPVLEDVAERASDAPLVRATALAELSLLARERGEWTRAEELARDARDTAETLDESSAVSALVYAASARSALRNSNWVRVSEDIDRVHALLPRLTDAVPWLSGQVRVELAKTHLALNDLPAVRELLTDLDVLLLARPHLGALRKGVQELREETEHQLAQSSGGAGSLTAAELRLLPLLTTHLTFRQIADHLYVSRNTIKTQAISVYRKLGVTSRAEAIDRANELGFLRPGETIERLA